jgi:predicted pyridoxine 5'-phosphate oxidase superfamily flavin-nucleotide-binding protein
MPNNPHLLTSLEAVRAIIGPESAAVRSKFYPALEETASGFIRHAPLLLLATTDREGRPTSRPKATAPASS